VRILTRILMHKIAGNTQTVAANQLRTLSPILFTSTVARLHLYPCNRDPTSHLLIRSAPTDLLTNTRRAQQYGNQEKAKEKKGETLRIDI
jgi:hypothetical protein